MKLEHTELKERLFNFSLDDPNATFSFSKRLAFENGWSQEYVQRVITEYKKFVFLAVVAGHPVTPSDQVDQVWHLHLLYTHCYWEEFCPKILLRPLHHGPTLGGQIENHKFHDWYSQTLASYTAIFAETPPSDIWPPAHLRFGRDVHFQRVNTQQNWIFPKYHLPQRAKIVLLGLSAIALLLCMPFSPTAVGRLFGFVDANLSWLYLCLTVVALPFAYKLGWYVRRFFS